MITFVSIITGLLSGFTMWAFFPKLIEKNFLGLTMKEYSKYQPWAFGLSIVGYLLIFYLTYK